MAYNYGPPPPAPPPAPPQAPSGYAPYYQPQAQRGGFVGHGGRGRGGMAQNADRGGYQGAATPYGYGGQPPAQQAYGVQTSGLYPTQHSSQQPVYPPQQPQPQQQAHAPHPQQPWHPEQASHHQQSGSHAPLPAQNYHPNYAPQMYQQPPHPQQQNPYPAQQPYAPVPPAAYGQGYPQPTPTQQPPPPVPHWGGPAQPQPQQSQAHYGGGGRGRGGRGDRGGKSQMMGPPIRMGFEHGNPPAQPAPVSSHYPPQSYGGPQATAAPYPPAVAYQGYSAPPAPYMPNAPHYDGHTGYNSRNRGGGQHNNFKSRSHFGGDKMRNRNRGFTAHTPPSTHQKPDAASAGKKKKRKTNTLGLTPGDESEEDDENEEQRLNELYGADAPNPTTEKDIADWIAERRANYPSKARTEARKAAARHQNGDSKRDKELEQKAERLRKQLEKVESSIKRKREQQDEGDEMRGIELTTPSSDEARSQDDKPEVMSTRPENNHLPPPPKKADPTKHCKYYSTGGNCGKKGKCRFVHDPAVREAALKDREMNGGRMTLQQRLTLNDKDQEDLTIVQTLKYLQDRGMMKNGGEPSSSQAASSAQPSSDTSPLQKHEPLTHSLPPIPPPPAKYQGWNMAGFGPKSEHEH